MKIDYKSSSSLMMLIVMMLIASFQLAQSQNVDFFPYQWCSYSNTGQDPADCAIFWGQASAQRQWLNIDVANNAAERY